MSTKNIILDNSINYNNKTTNKQLQNINKFDFFWFV
jgi:hypothetical protein